VLPAEAPQPRRHDRHAVRSLIVALAAAAALACCGSDNAEPTAATSDLTIELDADGPGGAATQEAQVMCPGADRSPEACAAIADLPADALDPVPPQTACTEIYGGPDVVEISGTLDGEEVDAVLTRANGCEIERFDRFVPVLEALYPEYRPGEALSP
jgi:hypothetical protein